jgi:glycosyltransferase involved in cell wall biosynthesis
VLAQSERDLEVIVFDDASSDATMAVVEDAAASDQRVRYVRREVRVGLTANFNAVFGAGDGEYVMVLADDDWLEHDYVARCRAALEEDERLALVCGSPIYHEPSGATFTGRDIDLLGEDPTARVRRYFGTVTDNVCIYGLMRRSLLQHALPMRNCLAGDWLLIARLALLGAIRTDRVTHVHRSTDGTSANFKRTVARMGLTSFEERHPHVAIMRLIYSDIARDSDVYAMLGPRARKALAAASAAQIARTRPLGLIVDELPEQLLNSRPMRALATRRRAAG